MWLLQDDNLSIACEQQCTLDYLLCLQVPCSQLFRCRAALWSVLGMITPTFHVYTCDITGLVPDKAGRESHTWSALWSQSEGQGKPIKRGHGVTSFKDYSQQHPDHQEIHILACGCNWCVCVHACIESNSFFVYEITFHGMSITASILHGAEIV